MKELKNRKNWIRAAEAFLGTYGICYLLDLDREETGRNFGERAAQAQVPVRRCHELSVFPFHDNGVSASDVWNDGRRREGEDIDSGQGGIFEHSGIPVLESVV